MFVALRSLRAGRTSRRNTLTALILSVLLTACGGGSDTAIWDRSTPPPALPQSSSERLSKPEAARFLVQASFGPSLADIDATAASGAGSWIEYQLNLPPTTYLPRLQIEQTFMGEVDRSSPTDLFWEAGVLAPDQLRQRMVYALSQILVISVNDGAVGGQPLSVAQYMDILSENAFGNYGDLLKEVTYSPAMANYLTYLKNRKTNMDKGTVPDENYAREIMQLFTIGLVALNPDGTEREGAPETYDNDDVKGLAKVFTGLSYAGTNFWRPDDDIARYQPLIVYPEHHSEVDKTFLGLTIPAGTSGEDSIDQALDHLIAHPNVAPFISRQLIQRFVTSNPSTAYVGRVAQTFEAGQYTMPSGRVVGDGRKGDLAATIAAILLDSEARQDPSLNPASFGKVREPTLRFWHWARAFEVASAYGGDVNWLADTSRQDRFGQHPFRAPSVFNFYRPQYVAPNSETGDANLKAPELQLVSEITHVGYVNLLSRFIENRLSRDDEGNPNAYAPSYAYERSLASTPEALVDHLDLILVQGELETETRLRIINTLNEILIDPDAPDDGTLARVHVAVLMAMTAPEFLVQK